MSLILTIFLIYITNAQWRCVTTGQLGVQLGTPSANGCAATGGRSFPDSLPGGANIRSCCDAHDICYGTCTTTKSQCDLNFNGCMRGKCDQVRGYFRRTACYRIAGAYHLGVRNYGIDAYIAAKNRNCCPR